jgi:hypothetical protein
MNLRSFDMANPQPDQCAQACNDDSQCKAFTFVKPGFQGPDGRCYLKYGVPDPVPNECCISGALRNISAEGQFVAAVVAGVVNIPPQITPRPEGIRTTPGIEEIHGTLERSLTGIWECSDGGLYYLRQSGKLVAWFAQSTDEANSWAQVGWGEAQAGILKIGWIDIPLRERLEQGFLEITYTNDMMITDSNVMQGQQLRWVRLNDNIPTLKSSAAVLQPELQCSAGCECLNRISALEKFEYPERCQQNPCGTSENGEPKYCFHAGEIPSSSIPGGCPSGCRCMLEELATSWGGMERCSETVCGYSIGGVPMYCFRNTT